MSPTITTSVNKFLVSELYGVVFAEKISCSVNFILLIDMIQNVITIRQLLFKL